MQRAMPRLTEPPPRDMPGTSVHKGRVCVVVLGFLFREGREQEREWIIRKTPVPMRRRMYFCLERGRRRLGSESGNWASGSGNTSLNTYGTIFFHQLVFFTGNEVFTSYEIRLSLLMGPNPQGPRPMKANDCNTVEIVSFLSCSAQASGSTSVVVRGK